MVDAAGWCFQHSPDSVEKRAESRRKGGEARARQAAKEHQERRAAAIANMGSTEPKNGDEARQLCAKVISLTLDGSIDAKTANAVSSLIARFTKLRYR